MADRHFFQARAAAPDDVNVRSNNSGAEAEHVDSGCETGAAPQVLLASAERM